VIGARNPLREKKIDVVFYTQLPPVDDEIIEKTVEPATAFKRERQAMIKLMLEIAEYESLRSVSWH
jgi:hypothetical protein